MLESWKIDFLSKVPMSAMDGWAAGFYAKLRLVDFAGVIFFCEERFLCHIWDGHTLASEIWIIPTYFVSLFRSRLVWERASVAASFLFSSVLLRIHICGSGQIRAIKSSMTPLWQRMFRFQLERGETFFSRFSWVMNAITTKKWQQLITDEQTLVLSVFRKHLFLFCCLHSSGGSRETLIYLTCLHFSSLKLWLALLKKLAVY